MPEKAGRFCPTCKAAERSGASGFRRAGRRMERVAVLFRRTRNSENCSSGPACGCEKNKNLPRRGGVQIGAGSRIRTEARSLEGCCATTTPIPRVCAFTWSRRLDSNQRPLAPHASTLPGCATSRNCHKNNNFN